MFIYYAKLSGNYKSMTEHLDKKVKRTPRSEPWIINFFECVTPNLHAPGQWRNPRDQSREYYKPEFWVKVAKLAEKGKIHGIFFGDSLAIYGGYRGPYNYTEAAKSGNNFPKNDPTAYVSAMSLHTKNVSFGITCSTLSEHPYHFARRYATLDHISNGRVGWNVVTSFLPSAGRQLTDDNILPEKALRYEKTDEYLQVFYELLLSSWRDDGVVFDRKNGIFSNPDAIREINFDGKYFKVPGPQITEPSPQRIPLIIQAGVSPKGKELGAKHAELIFLAGATPEAIRSQIEQTKKLAQEKYGRDPSHIKFVIRGSIIVAATHDEAVAKWKELETYRDRDGIFTQLGGGGLDLSKFADDEDLSGVEDPLAAQFASKLLKQFPGATITKNFIVDHYFENFTTFVGDAKKVADQLEEFAEISGVDGFNFTSVVFPETFENLVEYLIPELQERGLAQKDYAVENGTYREQVYRIKGHKFVPKDHYAYPLRWQAGVSKEEFEKHIAQVKEKQKKLAITAD